jgi:hypothetical protein
VNVNVLTVLGTLSCHAFALETAFLPRISLYVNTQGKCFTEDGELP